MNSNNQRLSIRNCIFGFQCKESWDKMTRLANAASGSQVRFCSGCEKEVYECRTDKELNDNVQRNRCVVIARATASADSIEITDGTPQVLIRDFLGVVD